MSKHLHKGATCGLRGLMAVLCLACSMQWALAVDLNSSLSFSANSAALAATDYTVTDVGAAIVNNLSCQADGSLKINSITVNKGFNLALTSNVQYANFYLKLHGAGIVNYSQANKANSREGLLLADELFEGTINWTAAKSLAYFGGANKAGQQGMPKGKFVFKATGSLFSGYNTDATMGGLSDNTVVKIGELQCADGYYGSSLNSGGFQVSGTINTYWEIGALNTDSYFAGSIKDGQLKGGYNGYTGIRKIGTGSLTLGMASTAASTYTLGTEILEGGIFVNAPANGLGTGPVNVASGAYLGGSGSIASTVIGNGAALRPGAAENKTGKLTINSPIFTWGGGSVDVDLFDVNNFDILAIISNQLVMPGNVMRVYVDKDFNAGDEFAVLSLIDDQGNALAVPTFTGIEVSGMGASATKIPVFDLNYLNTTGKLKITGFSMFSKTPRKLAGICEGTPAALAVETLLDGVTFTWNRDGSQVGEGASYTATQAGKYTVVASKGGVSETYEFEVREGNNPSLIAAGTSYKQDGDYLSVVPAAGETLEAYQWYIAPVDNEANRQPIDFEWADTYMMSTSAYYSADIYSELGCMTHLESKLVRFEPAITLQPVGNTEQICEGSAWQMSIAATTQAADGKISYQWHYLGDNAKAVASEATAIAGATTTSYTARQSGYYTAYLADSRGSTYSDKVYVNITSIDLAGFPTADVKECASDYLFSVSPKSSTNGTAFAEAAYAWYNDGNLIAGADSASYKANANGLYSVQVTVGSCVKTSKDVTLSLSSAGKITKDLNFSAEPITVCAGESVNLSIEAEATSGTLTYQWYKDGKMVYNATAASYSPEESGTYSVQVSTDGSCTTTSATKDVTFMKVPTIRTQPFAAEYIAGYPGSLCDGQMADLSVFAVDVTSYQWYKDGQAIEGAVNADFETSEAGTYYVMLSNQDACVTKSDEVNFITKKTPTSTIEFNMPAVCSGMLFELDPVYADVADSYAWYKDSVAIVGANVSSYATRYNGNYYVEAKNECGTGISNTIAINAFSNPEVLVDLNYSTLTANVQDANTATLTYQWTLDEQNIPNANQPTYMVKKNGNYAVVVTNENGCSTTSTTKLIGSGVTAADPDLALQSISAYPNPSTGVFQIQGLPADAQSLIQVDNLAGATIFSQKVNAQSEAVIDITSAPAGMYFIKVVSGQNTITKKVTVEK